MNRDNTHLQSLQLTVLQFSENKTTLVLLTCPTISAPKRDIPPTYLQMSGNVPEYVPILKTQ